MRELNAKEKDLLDRIERDPDLRIFFFRKAKGLHWFDPLNEKGYFSPENNPNPVSVREEGYVTIPPWPATEYLIETAKELTDPEYEAYAVKFMDLIRNVTRYARNENFSNYKTWKNFSKVLSCLPAHLIQEADLDLIDYWLDDKFEHGMIADELSKSFLPKLFAGGEKSSALALEIINRIFSLKILENETGSFQRKFVQLRLRSLYAMRIVEAVALLSGQRLGLEAVKIFESKLTDILGNAKNDAWTYIWRPAIEEHDQNDSTSGEGILIAAYRDCLLGAVDHNLDASIGYLQELLVNKYQTFRRLAVFAIDQKFDLLSDLTDEVLFIESFSDNLRHEVWCFLNHNFSQFKDSQKKKVIEIIESLNIYDEDQQVEEASTAYRRSIWLNALKDADQNANALYQKYIAKTGTKPEHPAFSSYMRVGRVVHESPFPIEELLALSARDLIVKISTYEVKNSGYFGGPSFQGLTDAFKEVVKSKANKFYLELDEFLNLQPAFIHEMIEAYRDRWNEKADIPWNDIWPRLLVYCSALLKDERFWLDNNANERGDFVASKQWVVSSIAKLIEDGTKSDAHAFESSLLPQAKEILLLLLSKLQGAEFKIENNLVSIAINSPRGHSIIALINLSLRACRLADKEKSDHSNIWHEYELIYADELVRSEKGEYEFVTLVANYLPNFLYMSTEWVLQNLSRIFDQTDYQKWRCAMQGYAYINKLYKNVYDHLKNNCDLVRALDDSNIEDFIKEKIIQNILVSFLSNDESLDDSNSLISVLLERARIEEFHQLIWFIWTLRRKDRSEPELSAKVFELWPRLLEKLDFESKEARKLASMLCHWAEFIDKITDVNQEWLLRIAPYANENYNSDDLLRNLARMSQAQPMEAQRVWLEMLSTHSVDYADESIKQILTNLAAFGNEGKIKATEIVDAYIKHGNEQPRFWLKTILENQERNQI